ncbi:MAG: ABC transporter substrate-binding protein [Patescibacteria group bacterium]
MNLPSPASLWRRLGSFIHHHEKLLLAILALVIAVSGSLWYRQYFNQDNAPVAGGTYVEGIVGGSNELTLAAAKLTKSGLFKINAGGTVENHLVDDWQVNAENTEYRFDLKRGIAAGEITGALEENSDLIGPSSIADVGDGVITVTLATANPNLPLLLTQPLFDFGPYKLSKISATTAIFTRNSNERALPAYLNKIVIHAFADEATLKVALEKGKVDGAALESSEPVAGTTLFTYKLPRYYAVMLNINKSPFRDQNYRRSLLSGGVVAAADVVLTAPDEAEYQPYLDQLVASWTASGLRVTVDRRPTAEIADTVAPSRDFQALLTGVSYWPELNPYYLWHSSQLRPPGNNLPGIKDDIVDGLIGEIEASLSLALRYEKIDQLHARLAELGVAVILDQVVKSIHVVNNVVPAQPWLPLGERDRWQAVDQWYLK